MDATQRLILNNEIELNKMRAELGIKPRMSISHCVNMPSRTTFDLRNLNKELIKSK